MNTKTKSTFAHALAVRSLCKAKISNAGRFVLLMLAFLLLFSPMPVGTATAQNSADPDSSAPSDADAGKFGQVEKSVRQQLADSLDELARLRDEIKNQKIPLGQKLTALEDELSEVRSEYQRVSQMVDTRTLDLTNLRSEIKSRKEERTYLLNSLLSPYVQNFETRLHIAEMQRYKEPLEEAKLALENQNLSDIEIYKAQTDLVEASLERLSDALGGGRFEGSAIDTSGLVKPGAFVIIGPAALFRSQDGETVGTVEQRLGSLEPTVVAFESPEMTESAAETVKAGEGKFPLDPTLGNAHKIEATKQTVWEHVSKGGPVMYPILTLAAAAMLVATFKWWELSRVPKPSESRVGSLLDAVAEHDEEKAAAEAAAIGGPTGEMLSAGVEHIKEPPALIEEVMYEKILTAKMRLQRFLPFVAISAAAAPLLGLLGTVTGIINTFKLITVFGSGDVKTLSGGISEALITTEFGLIVAIPSLLLHAFLSRKARGMIARMEKTAISFINQISKTPYKQNGTSEMLADMPAAVAREVLRGLKRGNGKESAQLSRYSKDSAGSIMDPKVVTIANTATVAEAIGMIRSAELDEDAPAVFVTDDKGKYIGDIRIHKLLTRPEQVGIDSLVDRDAMFVRVDTNTERLKQLFKQHDLVTVPVLNEVDQPVGRITIDRVNGDTTERRSIER